LRWHRGTKRRLSTFFRRRLCSHYHYLTWPSLSIQLGEWASSSRVWEADSITRETITRPATEEDGKSNYFGKKPCLDSRPSPDV
jgi:hypothetical protein